MQTTRTDRQTDRLRELTTSVNEVDLGQFAVGDGGLEVERGQRVGGVLQGVAPRVQALVLTHPGEHLLQRQLGTDAHDRLLPARQVDGKPMGDLQHGIRLEVRKGRTGRARNGRQGQGETKTASSWI